MPSGRLSENHGPADVGRSGLLHSADSVQALERRGLILIFNDNISVVEIP